jgi:hypothetical protein
VGSGERGVAIPFRGLASRWHLPRAGPIIAGLVSLLIVWWTWGAVNPIPVVSDEQSYVLQSKLFASGHWTAPSPPIPEAFEQSHVLTTPAVASKFPPGHALLLTIGTLLGSPAIASLLLSALTGALLYLLVRRLKSGALAALTVVIWLSDPINLRFRPSYFSEVTTQLLWLASWWALLEWRETHRSRWLFALAVAIGWGAITRPLTMLAFAIPVSVIVIRDVIRTKQWRDLAIATAIGTAILGVIPIWSVETTGDWRLTPLTLYQRDYLPFDKPGFGVDATPPAKPLNPVNQATYAEYFREHVTYMPRNLPLIIWDRLRSLAITEWESRLFFVPFVVIGLFALNTELWFAVVCSAALFVGYLSYGHFAEWTLYYFEAMPIVSVITAIGLQRTGAYLFRSEYRTRAEPAIRTGPPPILLSGLVSAGLLLVTGALVLRAVSSWRQQHIAGAAYYTQFNGMVAQLPRNPTVIFVHYAPRLQAHPTLVQNSPHLDDEPIWIVNDLGPRDPDLMRIAGGRVPLAFFEDGMRFELDRSLLLRSH